jgi:hypothetical protein
LQPIGLLILQQFRERWRVATSARGCAAVHTSNLYLLIHDTRI